MNAPTWKAAVLLTITFLAGGVAGGAAVGLSSRRPPWSHGDRDRHGESGWLDDMTVRLHLTPAQRDSIQAVLTRYRPRMDSIWGEVRPRFETLRDSIGIEIRAQLSPEQTTTYNDMVRRYQAERHGTEQR
jgi:Spy/CpxP family protein refolding chaperone